MTNRIQSKTSLTFRKFRILLAGIAQKQKLKQLITGEALGVQKRQIFDSHFVDSTPLLNRVTLLRIIEPVSSPLELPLSNFSSFTFFVYSASFALQGTLKKTQLQLHVCRLVQTNITEHFQFVIGFRSKRTFTLSYTAFVNLK